MSLNASPMILIDSTVNKMARPGNVAYHEALPMYVRAVESMAPHSGDGGRAPKPRKLSPAIDMIAVAIPTVARTIIGADMLGKIWRTSIRTLRARCNTCKSVKRAGTAWG